MSGDEAVQAVAVEDSERCPAWCASCTPDASPGDVRHMGEEFSLILEWIRPEEYEDSLSGRTHFAPVEFTAEIYQLAGATWPVIAFGIEGTRRLECDISEVEQIGDALTGLARDARAGLRALQGDADAETEGAR
jgi:hypothetical protein